MRQWPALVLALVCAPLAAQTWTYACHGTVRTESIFETGTASERERSWMIVANETAGYVKRDPEIAAGCVEPVVEICGCELGADMIRCRSLGISPAGDEIGMDFSIDRQARRMQLSGRHYDPKSGQVIETSGRLACEATEQ